MVGSVREELGGRPKLGAAGENLPEQVAIAQTRSLQRIEHTGGVCGSDLLRRRRRQTPMAERRERSDPGPAHRRARAPPSPAAGRPPRRVQGLPRRAARPAHAASEKRHSRRACRDRAPGAADPAFHAAHAWLCEAHAAAARIGISQGSSKVRFLSSVRRRNQRRRIIVEISALSINKDIAGLLRKRATSLAVYCAADSIHPGLQADARRAWRFSSNDA